jgi:hypothetical protein
VFSLKQAWTLAQNYNINGNGQLYITFAGGTYAYSDAEIPDNLYHPQGGNIIIQGDPAAVKQRYLHRVQNYSWDISRISYHGHTGTVNLTNCDAAGSTHGYAAADTNMWVAISNPCLSSAGNPSSTYYDPTTQVQYIGLDARSTRSAIYGDMFFNNGYSYENANGIYGLAQIADATTSTSDLRLIFKNTNIDPRVPAFSPYTKGAVSNGIGNTIPWHGIDNNYPENQYSKPNGYYGKNQYSPGTYPAKVAGDAEITDQPHLVTSYPVVIQRSSTSTKPLFTVAGGTIKAIRNFMLVPSDFAVPNANANKTKALNALYPGEEFSPGLSAGYWGTALLRTENATVGIRHLGVYHAEFGICALNSKITTYMESSVETAHTTSDTHAAAAYVTYAKLGNPDNTPVLNAVNVRYGIHSHASTVQIGYESDRQSPTSRTYTTEQGCFIQAARQAIVATDNSAVTVRSAVINSLRALPRFQFQLRVPVFAGASASSGNTYSFMYPPSWGGTESTTNSNQAFQNGYTAAAIFMRTGAATGYTLGYITNIAGAGTIPYVSGQYTSTHSVAGTPVPAYWQTLNVYGYRVGDINGLSFSLQTDFSTVWLVIGGCTLEFIAFSDNETTAAGGKFEIGINSFKTTAAGGQSITGVSSGFAIYTLPYPIQAYRSYRWHSGTDDADTSVGVYSGSTLKVRKNLLFTAADNRAVYVSDGSKLLSAPSQNFSINAGADWQSEEVGGLLINGAGNQAVLVRNGSYAGLGSVYAKCFKSYLSDSGNPPTKTTQVVVAAEANSVAEFPVVPIGTGNYYESVVGVFSPFGAAPWSSNSGALGGVGYYTSSAAPASDDILAIMFRASKNSSIFIEPNTVAVISAFDGGSGEYASNSFVNFYIVEQYSKLGQMPKTTFTPPTGSTPPPFPLSASQFSHIYSNPDTTATQKIMSRSGGFKYALPTTSQYYRWWAITGSQPTTLAGRTAGVWSATGESVRKILFGFISIYAPNAGTFNNTTHRIALTCPNFSSTITGATYNTSSSWSSTANLPLITFINYHSTNISCVDTNSIIYANVKN